MMVLGLLLLSGAVVNVAVAWALVGAPDSWTPGGPAAVHEDRGAESLRAYLWAPPSWGPAGWVRKRRGLGWTTTDIAAEVWHGCRIDGGWPARSMAWVKRSRRDDRGEWERHHSASIEVPLHALMDSGWFETDGFVWRDQIPLTPVFPGFAINTLFYAALLALPLGVSLVRRRGERPESPADGASRGWRRARWLVVCIIAVAMTPGATLAFIGSVFGATLVLSLLASVGLWIALLAAVTHARSWAALLPAAVILSIVSQFIGVVVMAMTIRAVVQG